MGWYTHHTGMYNLSSRSFLVFYIIILTTIWKSPFCTVYLLIASPHFTPLILFPICSVTQLCHLFFPFLSFALSVYNYSLNHRSSPTWCCLTNCNCTRVLCPFSKLPYNNYNALTDILLTIMHSFDKTLYTASRFCYYHLIEALANLIFPFVTRI